jgi:hypothetical protein
VFQVFALWEVGAGMSGKMLNVSGLSYVVTRTLDLSSLVEIDHAEHRVWIRPMTPSEEREHLARAVAKIWLYAQASPELVEAA